MKVKKQIFGLELISIFTKHGHIILFAYFLFSFVSCNTLRNYQIKETCIPISILGSYNMKDLSSEDINAVMKQRLCSSDLKQIEDIKIEVKTLRDYREFNRQIWKYFLYPWLFGKFTVTYRIEYEVSYKNGSKKSGIMEESLNFRTIEIYFFPHFILFQLTIKTPIVAGFILASPFLIVGPAFSDENLFNPLPKKAIEQMTNNLVREIVAKANQDIKE